MTSVTRIDQTASFFFNQKERNGDTASAGGTKGRVQVVVRIRVLDVRCWLSPALVSPLPRFPRSYRPISLPMALLASAVNQFRNTTTT